MKTSNRPPKGSILRKEPIRDLWAIRAIKQLLQAICVTSRHLCTQTDEIKAAYIKEI